MNRRIKRFKFIPYLQLLATINSVFLIRLAQCTTDFFAGLLDRVLRKQIINKEGGETKQCMKVN